MLLVAVGGVLMAFVFLVPLPRSHDAEPVSIPLPQPVVGTATDAVDIERLAARPLFSASRRPVQEAPAAVATAPVREAPAPPPTLEGTVVTRSGTAVAYLSFPGAAETQRLTVGERFGEWEVISIDSTAVALRHRDTEVTLENN